MTIKKDYAIGDTVWIHGVGKEKKLTKGTVVKTCNINYWGDSSTTYYIVAIPTHIDPLLEIRTWETISEDSTGPIGGFRNFDDLDATNKLLGRSGYLYDSVTEEDDPSDEQIQAAINKSLNSQLHQPLILKDANKPKTRRRFNRRRSKE